MLYYIYIGNNKTAINHLNTITDWYQVRVVSSVNKAVKIINGIRERYNTSILYEQKPILKRTASTSPIFTKSFHAYTLSSLPESYKQNTAKPICRLASATPLPPQADKESIQRMSQFLQIRQQHKNAGIQ